MKIERVDDIPLIIAELERSGLSDLLNKFFPDHGNWQGLSGGKVTTGFLTYVLSCSDHRLSHVEPWVAGRLHVLGHCLGAPEVEPGDFSDDRLGSLLDRLSDNEQWNNFECALNQSLIRVHQLPVEGQAIRLDACIIQSFRKPEGLFQMGHSKQHRADLPQIKAMLATLDPLSMPLAVEVVSGEKADDPLYIPVIDKVSKCLDAKGLFYVGDAKLGSLGNRAYLQQQGHYYLCPLAKKQCSTESLKAYLEDYPTDMSSGLFRLYKDEQETEVLTEAFECHEELSTEEGLEWQERRIVVHSLAWAEAQRRKINGKLNKAQQELEELLTPKQRKQLPKTREAVEQKVQQILKKHSVTALFDVQIEEQRKQTTLRKYGNKPGRLREDVSFSLHIERRQEVIEEQDKILGWRVYATNIPKEKLSVNQAVLCYRKEYRIEHKFNQLLNKVTALMPVFLKKEHRIVTLTKLMLLALKFVSLIQHKARKELQQTEQYLKELFPGNPGRKTNQPTTEMLLKAFNDISMVIIPTGESFVVKLAKLKQIQLKILELLKIPPEVYLGLERISFFNTDFIET